MKIIIVLLLLLCQAVSASACEAKFLGRTVSEIHNTNILLLTGGFLASLVAHESGHLLAMQLYNSTADWNGVTSFHVNRSDETDGEMRNIARAGFVSQLLVGTLLNSLSSTKDSDFTLGYRLWTAGEVLSYPIRRSTSGDLAMLEEYGGNGKSEYAAYAAWATGNLFSITW